MLSDKRVFFPLCFITEETSLLMLSITFVQEAG
jgi:hypothetical protein